MNPTFKVKQALGLAAVLGAETEVGVIEQRMAVRLSVLVTLYRACGGMTTCYCLRSDFITLAEMSEEEADDMLEYWTDLGMIVFVGRWNGKRILRAAKATGGEEVFRMSGQGIDMAEKLLVAMDIKGPLEGITSEQDEEQEMPVIETGKLPVA